MLQQHTQALAGRKNNHHGQQWMMSYRCFTIKVWPERFRSRIHPPGNFWILEILHGITGKSPQIGWVKMDTANKSTLLVSVSSLFGRWPIKLADLPHGVEDEGRMIHPQSPKKLQGFEVDLPTLSSTCHSKGSQSGGRTERKSDGCNVVS